jgi:glycosyltransferase involved in cell wall biosynthesis
MKPISVLHICGWYPNVLIPAEAPFVQRHIQSLNPFCKNEVWHVEVYPSQNRTRLTRNSLWADRTLLAQTGSAKWIFLELFSLIMLVALWWRRDHSKHYDIVNIHIPYPLAVHTRFIKRMFGVPVVFIEQWSAYHYSFHSKSRGLDRIRKIFGHDTPLICVSRSLLQDIESFSGIHQGRAAVLDNVAETAFFHWKPESAPSEGRFFAIAGWRYPKRPMVLIEMMTLLRDAGIKAELRLAGDGQLMDEMKRTVEANGLSESITFLGRLNAAQAANEMRLAHTFLHCSDYETYSAVCAEALCCGTPVIASNVGGIPEYMNDITGFLVDHNDAPTWANAIRDSWTRTLHADRRKIAEHMESRASSENVGRRYLNMLLSILRTGNPEPKS